MAADMAIQLTITMVVCAFLVNPSKQNYADETACVAENQKITYPLPYSSTGETLEITFACTEDKKKVTACQLPDTDLKPIGRNIPMKQDFTGKDGSVYAVFCYDKLSPSIVEDFIASEPEQVISTKFALDSDSTRVQSCTPKGFADVLAGKSAIIDGPRGKGKYKFTCLKYARPVIRLTFAAEVCAEAGAVRRTEFRETNSASGYIWFSFECNKAKDAIRKCNSVLHDGEFVDAGAKSAGFGGDFGNRFMADCSAIDGPSNVVKQNFGEQVCSTTKDKVKSYKLPKNGVWVKITFLCDGMKIAACKPDQGKMRPIKAGTMEVVGGVAREQYNLKCKEKYEPDFPV